MKWKLGWKLGLHKARLSLGDDLISEGQKSHVAVVVSLNQGTPS